MYEMKRLSKYFFLGFLFHLLVGLMAVGSALSFFAQLTFIGVATAVVLAVGIVKGGKYGVAFGASYFLSGLMDGIIFYRPYWQLGWSVLVYYYSNTALRTFISVAYGYLPANFYWRESTGGTNYCWRN